jgi:hypothetical protein
VCKQVTVCPGHIDAGAPLTLHASVSLSHKHTPPTGTVREKYDQAEDFIRLIPNPIFITFNGCPYCFMRGFLEFDKANAGVKYPRLEL